MVLDPSVILSLEILWKQVDATFKLILILLKFINLYHAGDSANFLNTHFGYLF